MTRFFDSGCLVGSSGYQNKKGNERKYNQLQILSGAFFFRLARKDFTIYFESNSNI